MAGMLIHPEEEVSQPEQKVFCHCIFCQLGRGDECVNCGNNEPSIPGIVHFKPPTRGRFPERCLSIDPGVANLGLAVFEGSHLLSVRTRRIGNQNSGVLELIQNIYLLYMEYKNEFGPISSIVIEEQYRTPQCLQVRDWGLLLTAMAYGIFGENCRLHGMVFGLVMVKPIQHKRNAIILLDDKTKNLNRATSKTINNMIVRKFLTEIDINFADQHGIDAMAIYLVQRRFTVHPILSCSPPSPQLHQALEPMDIS